MSVFQRASDIVAANVNGWLDRVEDPCLMLRKAVRDMDESIDSAMQGAVKIVAHEKVLAQQLAAEQVTTQEWQARAEAAMQHGDEEAARHAIRQKLDCEPTRALLTQQWEDAARAAKTLRGQIEAMRIRAIEAKRKLYLLEARQQAAKARQHLAKNCGAIPADHDAFQRFERMHGRIAQMEAEAEALVELTSTADGNARFNDSQTLRDFEIEAELASLRSNLKREDHRDSD